MTHASLFTGIGGFDLAAEWCGWENSFQCEINDFCQKVLAKNFPHADRYTDIKQFDARRYRGTVDVLSGGFPCQPYSSAGLRKGNKDDRALWPENLRIIDEVQPPWVVGENVAGLASLGLDGVLFDLEATGYEVETVLLPACGVGAPHRRDRLWIIAHSRRWAAERRRKLGELGSPATAAGPALWDAAGGGSTTAAYPTSQQGGGLQLPGVSAHAIPSAAADASSQQRPAIGQVQRWQPDTERGTWRLTEPPLCGPNDGIPAGLVRVSTRAKQLKAYGNSIVPQVAYEIFQAIQAVEHAAQN